MTDEQPAPRHDHFDLSRGESVDLSLLIRSTPHMAVIANSFIAYRTGFTFLLHLVKRHPSVKRLGVRASDMRVSINDGERALKTRWDDIGHGGLGWSSIRYQVLELPNAESISLVVDWPSHRVTGLRAEIKALPLRQTAARSESLWP